MLQLVVYNLKLHLIAITSTGIILVIWCDHKLMIELGPASLARENEVGGRRSIYSMDVNI